MRATVSVIGLSGVLIALVAVGAMWLWEGSGGQAMSIHGYLALGLGALFTFWLTAGLMALVFYSSRHGYDDEAGSGDEIDERIP
ncbi:hypothetical protein T8K17_01575 [Thalassobaculum sp. OXR-137]|uniref:hypothetical protein n=1 Tax=Thalassobaculum sp. OXR-137 TaxID=3100173 RepID=UPI002AC96511|nr:hypothetical protein [Thalassobaculum sp. OXR-137]WPZ34839.1 hypothetical protein T8K17_01575 [Thalassobaculum sp. OXR-137]